MDKMTIFLFFYCVFYRAVLYLRGQNSPHLLTVCPRGDVFSACNYYQVGLSLKGQGSPHLSMVVLCRYVTWPRGDIFLYA